MTISLAICGAAGRMGRRLLALALADKEFQVVQALERRDHPLLGMGMKMIDPSIPSDLRLEFELRSEAQVLIDFTTPESTVTRASDAAAKGIALVVGTTGLSPSQGEVLKEVAKSVPVIHAPNYSLGVNLLFRLAGEIAKVLGPDFDIEIVECHHNQKADAPSGTALGLAKSICAATGRDITKDLVHGRQGRPGARSRQEIGMHALRMGSVVGEHTLHFASEFERIELTHRAQNRDVFASGALRAAKWIVGRPAGFYTMEQVLFGL